MCIRDRRRYRCEEDDTEDGCGEIEMVETSGEDGTGENAEKNMGMDTRGQKTKGKTEEEMGGIGGGLFGKMSATKYESAEEKRNSVGEERLEKDACAADRMKNPSWERK